MPDFDWFAKKPHSTTSDLQPHQQPKMEDLDHVPGGEDAQTETTPSEAKMQRDTAAANDLIKQVVGSKLRESGDDPEALWTLVANLGQLKGGGGSRGYHPLAKGRAVEAVDWLEELYHYMTTSSVVGGDVCPAVRVPLTLVFRYTRPHVWYECRTETGGGIRQSHVTETSDEIVERFRRAASSSAEDVLAMYIYNKPLAAAAGTNLVGTQTCIEYFDLQLLQDFLRHRHREHDGILQQFAVPTGGRSSCMRASVRGSVRAAVSNLRLTLESRTNLQNLSDTRRPVRNRTVTFDGAEHESKAHALSPLSAISHAVAAQAEEILKHIAVHIPQQYDIVDATAYFRVHDDGQLYLLFLPALQLVYVPTNTHVRPEAFPSTPRAHQPELSYLGKMPHDFFRCPTCGKAVPKEHRTQVPFRSVLMHVSELHGSEGAKAERGRKLRRINSVLDRVGNNPDYWGELYQEQARRHGQASTIELLKCSGYPGGEFEMDDRLESEPQRVGQPGLRPIPQTPNRRPGI